MTLDQVAQASFRPVKLLRTYVIDTCCISTTLASQRISAETLRNRILVELDSLACLFLGTFCFYRESRIKAECPHLVPTMLLGKP